MNRKARDLVLPIGAVAIAITSFQTGAALATRLFPAIGAQGAVTLRVSLAALLLLAIRRPCLTGLSWPRLRSILFYGVSLGGMNLMFYMALARIPLGVAVAIEFIGPLAVAAAGRRGPLDLLWLALAVAGLIALAPLGPAMSPLDPIGVGFAIGAGVCWGCYILAGRTAGAEAPGAATALGMAVAALVVIPFGWMRAGPALFRPDLLPWGLAVAVLSSALPYSLEMFALTRLPRATFGMLMSLEPAMGTLFGWLLLGQTLSARQDLAVGCIVAASIGAAGALAAKPDAAVAS